jgi:hypothetical protein
VWNVVLEQAMHRDDILAEEFDVLFDVALGNVAVMGNDLQGEILRRHAGPALADALRFIQPQMTMKGGKHLLYLVEELLSRWGMAKPVKENGIAFHFRYLQADVVCLYQLFQKLFNDVTAVRNLGGLDKLRKAADIRTKQERWLGDVAGLRRHENSHNSTCMRPAVSAGG